MRKLLFSSFVVILFSLISSSCSSDSNFFSFADSKTLSGGFEPADPHMDPKKKNYCYGCGSSSDENWACAGRSCLHNSGCQVKQVMNYISNPSLEHLATVDRMYEIRDLFMINFLLGQQYITYYYELSNFAIQNNMVNENNFQQYLDFGTDLLIAITQIRYNNSSAVTIDSELKVKIEFFLNEFRSYPSNDLINEYLDNIHNDLELYSGKSVQYIRNSIGI